MIIHTLQTSYVECITKKDKNGELKIVSTGMNNSFTTGEICYQLPIKNFRGMWEKNIKKKNDLLIRLHDDGKY